MIVWKFKSVWDPLNLISRRCLIRLDGNMYIHQFSLRSFLILIHLCEDSTIIIVKLFFHRSIRTLFLSFCLNMDCRYSQVSNVYSQFMRRIRSYHKLSIYTAIEVAVYSIDVLI